MAAKTNPTKIIEVTITDTHVDGRGYISAGTYRIECPTEYSAAIITGEDLLCDYAIRIIGEV